MASTHAFPLCEAHRERHHSSGILAHGSVAKIQLRLEIMSLGSLTSFNTEEW